ncbi:LysR family transcriptional regulator [Pseudomonas lactis]|uniref:LysR family transcriptional regulator n=1 Tax=Pseudomonas lactis TaxID=1615674 RepID=A0A7Y1M736_9PSED|nr:LysR family transcriptional regulator [Pseudomonas lactis]NNA76453.1 LysR family transcriptional regulator [Pseudomonas lactis]
MAFNYSLKQLRYLVTTIECGSISEASRRLNISNPAISSAIKDLENRFNLQIFIRHKSNGLILTPEGSSFFNRAISLLRDAREFEQQVKGDSGEISGEIVLACYDPIASCYLPELLASFKERFPAVKISLHVVHQHKIAEGLRSGAYDLALTYSAGLKDTHKYIALLPDLYPRAVLPADHILASHNEISLSMIADEPLILLDIWPSNQYFLEQFKAAGLQPNIAYKVPTIELVTAFVGQGLGVSTLVTLPEQIQTPSGKKVVTLALSDPLVASSTVVAWNRDKDFTRLTTEFVNHCKKEIKLPRHMRPMASERVSC